MSRERGQSQKSITSITHSGMAATVTLSGHGYSNGDLVEITGASDPLYNGRFVIFNVTSTTFDYTMTGTPAANASGTLKAKKVSVDDQISRVSFLADDSSGSIGTHLEEYSYLGLGTIVQRNRPEPGTKLTYIKQGMESNGEAGDQYAGLDQFGRVIDQRWYNGSSDIDRYQYGYDRDSNVLYKKNTLSSANSELYHSSSAASGDDNSAYDGLNRLIDFARGTLTSTGHNGSSLDSISGAATDGQSWDLDQLGNSNDFTSWVGLISTITPGTAQTTTSGWYGEEITVGSNDLTVTQLGRMYVSGNTGTHTVKIVDVSNGSDVTGGSVSIATSGGEAGMIQYVSLSTPVTLTHGHSYYIVSQETSGGDQWYDSSTVLTTTSAATIVGAASNTGSWTVGGTSNRSWGPVDFRYVFVQSNTFNQQNEATGEGAATLTYDHNGNTTTDETGKQFVYDAWNRLHEVKDTVGNGGGSLETEAYDALGRRITITPNGGTADHLYYTISWQVIEERLGSSSNASIQEVWGLGYVDDLVLRDRDADANSGTGSLGKSSSGLEERLYAEQDANFNVTSITNTSGVVQERYIENPYGVVTVLNASWVNIGSSTKSWSYLHQGGRYDYTSGLYSFRFRDFSAAQARWFEPDPVGYVDSMNGYSAVTGDLSDPLGLAASGHHYNAFGTMLDPLEEQLLLILAKLNDPNPRVREAAQEELADFLIAHPWLEDLLDDLNNEQQARADQARNPMIVPGMMHLIVGEERDLVVTLRRPTTPEGWSRVISLESITATALDPDIATLIILGISDSHDSKIFAAGEEPTKEWVFRVKAVHCGVTSIRLRYIQHRSYPKDLFHIWTSSCIVVVGDVDLSPTTPVV